MAHPRDWMAIRPEGLYCTAGDFYVDPMRPVERAVITHGHADHARSGHNTVYATPETLAIMDVRYGLQCCKERVPMDYGDVSDINGVTVTLIPAGHILGSAQAVLEYDDGRIVISGDYKRRADPTCAPFQPVACDVFVTEATFGLPVFIHPPVQDEVRKLLRSLELFPDRCHLIGCYALGKCQRLIMELRMAGYTKPVYLHGALRKLCDFYQAQGIDLGELIPVSQADKKALAGEIVLAPPSALADRWSRNLPNVLTGLASGWMRIRARARQKLVELPLIISDHCDWDELLETAHDVGAPEVWITHGRDDALSYELTRRGFIARPLHMLGYEEDHEE